jgi:hypothetical protein
VEVVRNGGFQTGYTWTLTFVTPRGDIPVLSINTTTVKGERVNGTVVKVQNGSEEIFWYDRLPSALTEVPLEDATKGTVKSNVEVYVQGQTGEYLKAVCDGSQNLDVITSQVQGNESTCQYLYSTSATAIINGLGLFKVDAMTTGIHIHGNHFNFAAEVYQLTVTIANHPCNVSFYNSSYIRCYVSSVPWGKYYPVVNFAKYGSAVLATDQILSFKQSIYSVSPHSGSFAGGQIVTISGRGFRHNATITLGNSSLPCEILHYSSSEIRCRTPASPYFQSPSPTLLPTETPSEAPTEVDGTDSPTEMPTDFISEDGTLSPTESPTEVFNGENADGLRNDLDSVRFILGRKQEEKEEEGDASEPWVHQSGRRLDAYDDRNTYQLVVDGMTSENPSDTMYTYKLAETPKIFSIATESLSSAMTYNFTMVGEFRPSDWNATILIGNEPCVFVNMTSTAVSCVLKRNRNFGAVKSVPVDFYIDNLGYASWQNDPLVIPTVRRGFAIDSIAPMNGSLMGGNYLHIKGFGFDEKATERHAIRLTAQGIPPLEHYADLLVSLGFNAPANFYPEDTFITCYPVFVVFGELQCYVPGHKRQYNETTYDVQVTLNNVVTACDVENCTYSQTLESTPVVYNHYEVLNISHAGEYTVEVFGNYFEWPGVPSFTVYNLPCALLSQTNSSAIIRTAPIPTGLHLINGSLHRYGMAYTKTYLQAHSKIDSVKFDYTSFGSLAGGAQVTISGFGFSPKCKENILALDVLFGDLVLFTINVNEFLYCSTSKVTFFTPSVLPYWQHGNATIKKINFHTTTATDLTSSASFDFQNVSNKFQYLIPYTPIIKFVNSTEIKVKSGGIPSGYALQKLIIKTHQLPGSNLMTTRFGPLTNSFECIGNSSTVLAGAYMIQNCTVPFLTAAPTPYTMYVSVFPYGYGILSKTSLALPSFKAKIKVNKLSSLVVSSINGGSNLTLSGSGFPSDLEVTVCGAKCTANYTGDGSKFECAIPAKLTVHAITDMQSAGIYNDYIDTLIGTYFSSLNYPASATLANIHDDNYYTYFQHYDKNCYVGLQLTTGYAAQPYRMRYYPRVQFATYIGNFVYEGLPLHGNKYIPLAYYKGARSGWNFLDAMMNKTTWFTAFRYRALDTVKMSQCFLSEIEFLGTMAFINDTCPIVVKSTSVNFQNSPGMILYDSIHTTAEVSKVFPSNGSAIGGETVFIYGKGFTPSNHQALSVKFSGVDCHIRFYNNTVISCITGARPPEKVETSSIKVLVGGKGYATVPDTVEYLYIDKWSALTSWKNQEPPVDGDFVWIPDGQVILLDENTPKLLFVLVEGSLYFDRTKTLTMDTYYLFILGGYFEVGTEEQPYEGNATITIWGDRYKTIEVPMVGDKFVAVASKGAPAAEFMMGRHVPGRYTGQLEVHGKKRLRTWTFVAHTAHAGSWNITTLEPVDFAAGEKVILTGNDRPSNGYQFEELTVAETRDGHHVYFTTPLQYDHTAFVEEIEGRTIPMRCEIGLLSRNVIIQGDDEVSDGQLYGVHTIAFRSGIYHMENAEIRRCGQAFNFGRYCTHSHMAGMMEGSYVKANSIHHSYQRAVTTHDTHDWEVRDNVAFNIQGHAYFVEDGTEYNNYITGNLGIYILKSSALLMSDMKPAVFWTSTPTNYWRDNVAVHSVKFGFWFEPAGSADTYCPVHSYIGECWNNTLHSNSDIAMRIYPEYTPLVEQCGNGGAPSAQYIWHLLAYHNGGPGVFGKRHGDIHHMYPTFVANGASDIDIVHYEDVWYTDNPAVQNALFVGVLPRNYHAGLNLGKFAIWGPQNEYFYVRNATFVNYGDSGAIAGCNECFSDESMMQGAFTTRFEQLKFVNSRLRIVWVPSYKEIMWDLDGTLAGVPDSMVTKFYDVINWPDACDILSPVSVYSTSLRCGGGNRTARIRRVQLDAVTPSQLSFTDVVVKSAVGETEFFFLPLDTYGWVFPAVTGINKTYQYIWRDAGISAYTLNLTLGRVPYLKETTNNSKYDERVTITYTPNMWDYMPYSFATTSGNRKSKYVPNNTTKPLVKMGDANFHNITVDVMLTNTGANLGWVAPYNVYAEAKLCPPKGCPIPPVPTIGTPMLWSKKNSWQSKKVPVAGQKVIIDANMWIVLDISPPKLGCIVVYGKLSFQSNATYPKSLQLYTQCIQVYGTLEIAGENKTAFAGDAEVILYGGKGASLPVTMTEGVFLGAKVIGVGGNFTAIGQSKNVTWVKLAETAYVNTSHVTLAQAVDWKAGDEVIISPTSYFTAKGNPWFYNTNLGQAADEIRTIVNIETFWDDSNVIHSVLVLNGTLRHTHLCEYHHERHFCGAVGVLTRNVRFVSQDSENPKTTSYGFGGHIQVFDMPKAVPPRLGRIELINVELKNWGKINSDKYAVALGFTNAPNRPPSIVMNCSFNSGYNFAVRATNVVNLTFSHNVVARTYGGGVLLDAKSRNYQVDNNLIVGARQLPSLFLAQFPWVRPISGITLMNAYGTCRNNLVAGSEDQGFTIANAMFHAPKSMRSLCRTTASLPYEYRNTFMNYKNEKFYGNEAVAGKGGLWVMAMGYSESVNDDCSIVDGFFAWRNAHTGIIAIDSVANILIHDAVLAENHIGVHLHFLKSSLYAFAGVVNSTIINSLAKNSVCGDLPDSLYLTGKQCHVFSTSDPLAQANSCKSVLADIYKRVGILVPLWTNKARTCIMSGELPVCDPPNTPGKLCQMPWEKRYALPIPNLYSELHLHDVNFIGFNTSSVSNPSMNQHCVPSLHKDRSVAVAINPTEYDTQPTIISSGLSWPKTNVNSRFGYDQGAWAADCQGNYPCTGQDLMIWHDQDGTFSSYARGQVLMKNPELIAPFPYCIEVPELGFNLYYCPTTAYTEDSQPISGFKQYSALWDDSGPQVIQPLITSRKFEDRNVSVASYGPQNDLCAMRFYYSQFNFLWADRQINYVMSTGTIPSTWFIRWDAPSSDNVAIVQFFIQNSQVINVYVSDNAYDGYVNIPHQEAYPTYDDPAGTNQRDPQRRFLAVTIRGGRYKFYKFVVVPYAAVTIKMDMKIADFFADKFVANMALLLNIASSRIKVTSVRAGSVIADFQVSPAVTVANSTAAFAAQVSELGQLTANLSQSIATGAIQVALNVTVDQVFAVPPTIPAVFDPIADIPANSTYNDTEARAALIAAAEPQLVVLFTYPTSYPTGQPSRAPTSQPSGMPSGQPTRRPSSQPSSQPTNPTGRPTSFPSSQPSRLPTSQPSGRPISQPTAQPSRQPTREPNARPSSLPSGRPSTQPTPKPTLAPTRAPSALPTYASPSVEPTMVPSASPSANPTESPSVIPTAVPSQSPSAVPSMAPSETPTEPPTEGPSVVPTASPTQSPSAAPSEEPTASPSTDNPTVLPTDSPTRSPTVPAPTWQPTPDPTETPTEVPTEEPSALPTTTSPSFVPTATPTETPSDQPTFRPTGDPTAVPSDSPTTEPTESPSVTPTETPSAMPSEEPTLDPTEIPSASPTEIPSAIPTKDPTMTPTATPTVFPTRTPSEQTTEIPSTTPTFTPSVVPTVVPSEIPTEQPSESPTEQPTEFPSLLPSVVPTIIPSELPTFSPTTSPSMTPSAIPSPLPTTMPTTTPSEMPIALPTERPTEIPTISPSAAPTAKPTLEPSVLPTEVHSVQPTVVPSTHSPTTAGPSMKPSQLPTVVPTMKPSALPTQGTPTTAPTAGVLAVIEIACDQTIHGCSASDFNSGSNSDGTSTTEVFEDSIASVSATEETGTPAVNVTDVSDITARRRTLVTKTMATSGGVQLKYTVTYSFSSSKLSVISANTLYNTFTIQLKAAITNGTLVKSLQASGIAAFSNLVMNVSDLTIANYTMILVQVGETPSPKKDDNFFTADVITGIAIGSFFFVIIIGFVYTNMRQKQTKNKFSRKASQVIPTIVPEDGFSNIQVDVDVERMNTPDTETLHRLRNKGNGKSVYDFNPGSAKSPNPSSKRIYHSSMDNYTIENSSPDKQIPESIRRKINYQEYNDYVNNDQNQDQDHSAASNRPKKQIVRDQTELHL